MNDEAVPVVNRTRRRLYEAPADPAIEGEVLPPVCRETPMDVDRNRPVETDAQARTKRGAAVINKYTTWSTAIDFIPLGWLGNSVVCGAVNVNMIRDLCACYGLEFRRQWAATAVTATVGAIVNAGIITFVGRGMASLVPGAGWLLTMMTSAASSGSVTYLTGRVFVYHFELGGTLFDLNADKTRAILLKLKAQGEAAVAG